MKEIIYTKKSRIKRIVIGAAVGLILLAALVIFGLFRVQEVVISGNSTYTAEEIRSAVMQDGLCKNTLYLLWKYKDDSKVAESLPFLSSIEIEMVTPYKVQIRVYEKPEIGCFLKGSDYIYFDRDGLVIEITKEVREGVPLITGQAVGKATQYEKLPIEDEEAFADIIDLAQYLHRNDLKPKEIKFVEDKTITLYFESVKVKLGSNTDLEDKIIALKSVYGRISGQEGILHMESFTVDAQTITFKQGEEEEDLSLAEDEGEAVTEPETDENGEIIAATDDATGEDGADSEAEGVDDAADPEAEPEVPTYSESDGTFATDSAGNSYYTDKAGNVTYSVEEYNFTDENGGIITDGYGYIDPYTGGYIID